MSFDCQKVIEREEHRLWLELKRKITIHVINYTQINFKFIRN